MTAKTQPVHSGALGAGEPLAHDPGETHDSAAPDPRIGTLLKGTYTLERLLGAGGMGAVYLAQHALIRKKVAIKILAAEYAHKPELKERFLREARAAAAISDDHVIEIHDFGETPDGAAFFVMEYLQGEDLAGVIQREAPLPWPRARAITLQICRALQAAHASGIVHRDMKPGNCFVLARDGADLVKVLDFGIAKLQNPDESVGQALTRTGMIFGTPEYMSPEQAQGQRHDHRVDIYAVGVILFELLTGSTPFTADTFMGLLNKHMFEAPPRPSDVAPDAAIPAAAEAVVLKALQKNPDLRFQTMDEMAAALRAVDAGVAPVVVREDLHAPATTGAIGFRNPNARVATLPETTAPGSGALPLAEPPPPRRRAALALFAGLGGAVVAMAAIVIFAQQGASASNDGTGPIKPAPVASSPDLIPLPAKPEKPVTKPDPAPDLIPLPPPTVTVRIDTGGLAAQIYDEQGASLGSTADPAGLHLPRGAEERVLRLRAEGRLETVVKLIPSEDRGLTVELAPAPAPPPTKTGSKKPNTPKTGKPETKTEAPPPDTKIEPLPPEPKPDKPATSPDLISPFKKK